MMARALHCVHCNRVRVHVTAHTRISNINNIMYFMYAHARVRLRVRVLDLPACYIRIVAVRSSRKSRRVLVMLRFMKPVRLTKVELSD